MYLLKQNILHKVGNLYGYLHSTMYLLKLPALFQGCRRCLFTFHYVSIKTEEIFVGYLALFAHLHSTMYLLKPAVS